MFVTQVYSFLYSSLTLLFINNLCNGFPGITEFEFPSMTGTEEQFRAYRVRKKLLLKRMWLGALGMCCLIAFLAWLQWYIPTKNRAFWSAGREPERNEFSKSNVSNLFIFLLQMFIPHRFWLWSGFSFLAW